MILNREEAIYFLAIRDMGRLELTKREGVILELPDSDSIDLNDISDPKYNKPVIEWIISGYKGVSNQYIELEISNVLSIKVSVVGKQENLFCCPCCNFKTLDERGQYFICKVCFWEDDGNNDETKYSSVNRMFLREARENFIKEGYISQNVKTFVDDQGKHKYIKCL